jgi:hypothetical protein
MRIARSSGYGLAFFAFSTGFEQLPTDARQISDEGTSGDFALDGPLPSRTKSLFALRVKR